MAIDRAEISQWLQNNCPPEMRMPGRWRRRTSAGAAAAGSFKSKAQKLWLERMRSRGASPFRPGPRNMAARAIRARKRRCWPGNAAASRPGRRWSVRHLDARARAARNSAREEQKTEYLPRIARGEIRWCQGYSEPGAGSDLASLRTKAEDKGDHFLVNGQKIWTSYADKADWIFCLVRTDPAATIKQKGISFLLIDMATPGVSTKPIVLISGKSPFCETFFDDVAVAEGEPRRHAAIEAGTSPNILLTHERGYDRGRRLQRVRHRRR